MKKIRLLILIIIVASLPAVAQKYLNIKKYDGTKQSALLSSVRKLTFNDASDTARLVLKSGTVVSNKTSGIQNFTFDSVAHGTFLTDVNVIFALSAGWNMFGVPVTAPDMTVATLFPGATSPVYGYNSGYYNATALATGTGYWVRYPAASINVTGTPVTPRTVSVNAGWNIITLYENDVPVTALNTTPADIITSPFYGFDAGYSIPAILQSGKGYWVHTAQAGVLNIPVTLFKNMAPSAIPTIDTKWSSVQVSDAAGNKSKLFFSPTTQNSGRYELPPVPPAGIFDVRFASQSSVEIFNDAAKVISISGATYPVEVRAEGIDLLIKDKTTGELLNSIVKSGSSIVITNKDITLIEVSAITKPVAFELQQNYPNPFNPSTAIVFSVPGKGLVSLKVYDVLGNEVVTLVNEEKPAGQYSTRFDARNIASGVYFYTLKTGAASVCKKMIVLK